VRNGLGVVVGRGRAAIWRRSGGRLSTLTTRRLPRGRMLRLRMRVRRGRRYRFWVGAARGRLLRVGGTIDGSSLPPSDLGVRVLLTVGGRPGAAARFDFLHITPSRGRAGTA
jgi:hypothetical protein